MYKAPGILLTIQDIEEGEDFYWTLVPLSGLTLEQRVLFCAAHEIAVFLELTHTGPKEAVAVSIEAIQTLREIFNCLTAVQHLSPKSAVMVILKLNRFIGGPDDGLSWAPAA